MRVRSGSKVLYFGKSGRLLHVSLGLDIVEYVSVYKIYNVYSIYKMIIYLDIKENMFIDRSLSACISIYLQYISTHTQ